MYRRILFGVCLILLASSAARANTFSVHTSSQLQAAITAAIPGDFIVLDPGVVYEGPFTLPAKAPNGTNYITIQTASITINPMDPPAGIPAGQRATPANAANMAKIVTPGFTPALTVAPSASFYKIIGIEFRPKEVTTNVSDTPLVTVGLNTDAQNTTDKAPDRIELDRCYVHGYPGQPAKRGIALHTREVWVKNCYVADIHLVGQEAQGVTAANGPGPFHIVNNYVEAAGENVMFGGEPVKIPGVVPANIEVLRNYLYKPLSWRPSSPNWDGQLWTVKNIFELKVANGALIEGNLMENQWGDVNQEYGAVNLTVSSGDSGPQATLQNVIFRNNIVRHVGRGILLSGVSGGSVPNVPCDNLEISNNVFEDVDGVKWKHDGIWLVFVSTFDNVKIRHNTIIQGHSAVSFGNAPGKVSHGFEMTDNIFMHAGYGVIGANFDTGQAGMNFWLPGAVFRRNVMIGGAPSASLYSQFTDNSSLFYFPTFIWDVKFLDWQAGNFRLAANSPYKGVSTDAKDIGVDHDALDAATGLPNAPTKLTSGRGQPPIKLNWIDNSTNELGFKIEKYMNGVWSEIATTGPNVTTWDVFTKCSNLFPFENNRFRVRAFNSAGISATTNTTSPCIWFVYEYSEGIDWTNLYNVNVSNGNLYKTLSSYAWDAGAVSKRFITSGDGYAEMTPDSAGTYRMFGLSRGDSGPDLTDIDFALSLGEGSLAVYENGAFRGGVGTYVAGDQLRVAVEDGVVKYYKNDTVLYTSTIAPVYPLLIDTSLSTYGSGITGAKLVGANIQGPTTQPVEWLNVTGATASGNNLYKANPTYYWDAGAVSTKGIAAGDGYVEMTPDNAGTYRMFGLGQGDSGPYFTDIDFALSLGEGSLSVYEGGANRGAVGTYVAGDKLRVAVEGGVVKYYKNSTLLYTSTLPPIYPLRFDTSLSTSWGNITNAYISGVLMP